MLFIYLCFLIYLVYSAPNRGRVWTLVRDLWLKFRLVRYDGCGLGQPSPSVVPFYVFILSFWSPKPSQLIYDLSPRCGTNGMTIGHYSWSAEIHPGCMCWGVSPNHLSSLLKKKKVSLCAKFVWQNTKINYSCKSAKIAHTNDVKLYLAAVNTIWHL